MIYSRTKSENYLAYFILEIIMVSAFTFSAVGIVTFYVLGKIDTRIGGNRLSYLFDRPALFAFVCIVPVVISVSLLLYFRSRNYIVGFLFDDNSKELHLSFRRVLSKKLTEVKIPYDGIAIKDFKERKFLFNEAYKGKSIRIDTKKNSFDFVINNFIWEKQVRDRVYFIQEIDRIKGVN